MFHFYILCLIALTTLLLVLMSSHHDRKTKARRREQFVNKHLLAGTWQGVLENRRIAEGFKFHFHWTIQGDHLNLLSCLSIFKTNDLQASVIESKEYFLMIKEEYEEDEIEVMMYNERKNYMGSFNIFWNGDDSIDVMGFPVELSNMGIQDIDEKVNVTLTRAKSEFDDPEDEFCGLEEAVLNRGACNA